jgi:SnoaL-like protein
MSDSRRISIDYIEAVGRHEFAHVEALLDPNVEFEMAGRQITGAAAYIASLRKLAPIIVRNDIRTTVADGNEVAIFYDFVTDTPVGAVPSAEWLKVEGGKIRRIRLVFHSLQWPQVQEELKRRAVAA